ncbi:hypothetical protein JTE90_013342 [Oedothorax gibbosus]|uniref:Secreted protein n=1 Tax=Oedothorax gibbosus TaxID=931172 RepID=A0AAV6VD52_9ARAC|nr:hypothetical protein JTE90_013342 [Oedothorax gibbosus]
MLKYEIWPLVQLISIELLIRCLGMPRTGLSVGPGTVYSWRRPFRMTTNRLPPFRIGPAPTQSVDPPTDPAPIGRRPRDVTPPRHSEQRTNGGEQQEFRRSFAILPPRSPPSSFH